ncbi:MAG: precorrin-8X methylmutase [SAR324 cluster bacterium]|nr:precorrin-8X methylmutase [SAR324 cluster bacterium]
MSEGTDDFGLVIAGHGSRDADGTREFEEALMLLKQRQPDRVITHGFLEFATPTIDEALRENVRMGSRKIVMVPGILFAASHGKNDMPVELLSVKPEFPEVEFHYGGPMGIHPLLLKLFQERIISAEAQSAQMIPRHESLLVVVGRGTTDPDVNSNVNKLARMVEEGMGFGSSYVCYSGTAKPLVADGIARAARMGYRRVVVIPYFLFTGILIKRIYSAVDEVQPKFPDVEVLKAGYLGVHPHVTDVWVEKAREALVGINSSNCSLCKYRTQIVGYEGEVGKVQEAHHHHVRGILGDSHTHHHGAEAAHSHPHTHHQHGCSVDVGHTHGHSHHQEHSHVHQHKSAVKLSSTYIPHPIEAESFQLIEANYDWSAYSSGVKAILQRLVHTSGDFRIVEDVFFSPTAIQQGVLALLDRAIIVTDVTMVQSGLKRSLLSSLELTTSCLVHDPETHLLAEASGLTRSAAGIRRAFLQHQNEPIILAIGDAPTAIREALRLIQQEQWQPRLVIGLPVGFVGTRESKQELQECQLVPRITNQGTRGGSNWAAAVVNALMIQAWNQKVLGPPTKELNSTSASQLPMVYGEA